MLTIIKNITHIPGLMNSKYHKQHNQHLIQAMLAAAGLNSAYRTPPRQTTSSTTTYPFDLQAVISGTIPTP